MPYIKSSHIPKKVFHCTKREHLKNILESHKIIAFDGLESWFCLSLEDMLTYISLTLQNEGAKYVDSDYQIKTYPKFVPDEYVILELKPRYSKDNWFYYVTDIRNESNFEHRLIRTKLDKIKICYKGDLEFKGASKLYEVKDLIK